MEDGQAAAGGEGPAENMLVVMGEKGRSQLQRDMRDRIFATVAGARDEGWLVRGWWGWLRLERAGRRMQAQLPAQGAAAA